MRVPDWFYEEHESKDIEAVWDKIGSGASLRQVADLQKGLERGWGEREVQRFMMRNSHLLLGRCRTGHGTFAFGEKQLGDRYRIDWAIANGHSGGLSWELIELESPLKTPFKKDGELSRAAMQGVEQIQKWRRWVAKNIDQVQRSRADEGLGLYQIDCNLGLVVVGRRSAYDSASGRQDYDSVRKRFESENRIVIISYDTFVESLRHRFTVNPFEPRRRSPPLNSRPS